MKKFVIVGGGTAGWLTALVAQRSFPDSSVTVVESSKLGILGAGEGSTPHLVGLFDYLNIPLSDLIQNTSSTVKNGIMFQGWSKTKKQYLHSFQIFNSELSRYYFNDNFSNFDWRGAPLQDYVAEYYKLHSEEIDFATKASLQNKVLFKPKGNIDKSINPILNFDAYSAFSMHFDARSLAAYLAKVAQGRGINRIDSLVSKVIKNGNNQITSLMLEEDAEISGDFFFDCTGFKRLLIGETYNSKWVSFKESLPAKRAMPFFLDNDPSNIEPYTIAKAMNKGWIWKIPLQHRYGCGYVYDPSVISDEEVKQEIDLYVGQEVSVPTIFNFEPGYYQEVWKQNCLAVGLSNGFVEPLEATSILQSVLLLERFFTGKHKIFSYDQKYVDLFNKSTANEHEEIAAFIYLHYMTDKDNNEFWKNFVKNYKTPQKLEEFLPKLDTLVLSELDSLDIFSIVNYLTVAAGNGILNRESIKEIYEHIIDNKINRNNVLEFQNSIDAFVPTLTSHSAFLKYLGANFEEAT